MTEHFDVVIVGAGISGISTAWHLQDRCPTKSYVLLERRENIGGTWDLFKYPGIRSDSDMFTLGFRFKPWESAKAIADGQSIWNYINEAAAESGIDKHIRTGHKVLSADWSDADNKWTVTVEHAGEEKQITCSFVSVCSGYYNYDEGYSPEFPGAANFKGQIIHPQHWPEDLDYADKKIVVIGSGATAITLIPSLVDGGVGHVTMLQRSPTYVGSLPLVDPIAVKTNKYLPKHMAHFVNRWKAIGYSTGQYVVARRLPAVFKQVLRKMATRRLPADFDYDKHFSPRYNPWDERVCLAPNGDLFKAIRSGKADVVTDTIETFTETGIKLSSGQELAADIIVTATGLNMQLFGGATVSRNGEAVDLTKSMTYKGLMLSGVPNAAITFGYTNASWTLKADLVSEFICRVLNYMDANGFDRVEPQHPGTAVDEMPFMDFTPGYFRRAMDSLPKSGSEAPWRLKQNYFFDLRTIRYGKVDEESLLFTKHRAAVTV
ncbi:MULTISPECIES: NAD(P)/FAD-dependent oxidoreductase [unclassified Mycolicibacterium]|uniref:flavin-containing monooxygenase n=2 Tax=Mycolicibacterium TaxID=1866885 RepID=UPI0012DC6EF9|nr:MULTISPECIES: NAD(P)/FAD-dependent oxidoreductase [unclassified Mycolicibacterium]MUL83188.1 NAD(P)/FAD-dependent oxidoreductase [Mycolicibacterium sp. CBMA 329]MUL89523.1 NAD(P)/FAD-dependent oxidoreductase [Mycolicibacterium sp. CBMA 331]MUM27367.1 NAD(P)/FAD-dependent oxidoreductase [Mycolicibacterium sp. CBMA 295]MUM39039.1 NAD(P)/FAD-dependent oxidoreductase [Mycolicibacterium sp. CBMA 247]MUM45587.1 NAD(P)/FAD-dependent oxidoreductase [Mycolicibacterium sp. CBMA 294]